MITQQQPNKTHNTVAKQYFQVFNDNNFEAAAALFAPEGALHPPFEAAVVGPAAITGYLQQKAEQITAYPQEPFEFCSEDGQIRVVGHVDAIAFRVGVEWIFLFDKAGKIQTLLVKLRASMKELLSIRPD